MGRFTCRGVCLALCLVAGAEGAVRLAVWKGWLPAAAGFGAHMEAQRERAGARPWKVWWMGSSTLGTALDRKSLPRPLADDLLILIHGSASLRGNNALLEYYLRSAASAPRELVVFNQPTHMSLYGRGPARDTEPVYLEIGKTGRVPGSDPLMLRRVRGHLAATLERKFLALFSRDGPSAAASLLTKQERTYLAQIFADYRTDVEAIGELGRVARAHGIPRVVFVMMPVSRDLKEWFDGQGLGWTYAEVVEETRRACGDAGVEFWDASTVTEDAGAFKDSYHLNAAGASRFTEALVSQPVVGGE